MASGSTGGGMTNSQLGASFSAMLAAREAQDSSLRTPVADKQYATHALQQLANSQTLPLTQKQVPLPEGKQKDIDMILQGDFE